MNKLILPLLFAASVAQADVFTHPEADEVVVAGPSSEPVTVCFYDTIQDPGSPVAVDEWVCIEVPTYGAKYPIYLSFDYAKPVRVAGARWAFWRDSNGDLQPMSRYMQ